MKRQLFNTIALAFVTLNLGLGAAVAQTLEDPRTPAEKTYDLGIKAFQMNSLDAAVSLFKRAADQDPNLANAHFNLAKIYQRQTRYQEAIERYEQVLRLNANDPDAHYSMGVCYQALGRTNEARQQFMTIAPNNPKYADAQARLANINNAQAGINSDNSYQPQATTVQVAPQPQTSAFQPPVQTYQPQPYQASQPQSGTSSVFQQTGQTVFQPTPQQPLQPQAFIQSNAAAGQAYGGQPTTGTQPTVVAPSNIIPGLPAPSSTGPVSTIPNSSLRILASGFAGPAGLAFDKSGNLYIANFTSNTIDRISIDGTRMLFSSGANIRGPIGLTVDASGNVYVANYNNGTVARVSPAGVASIVASGFKKPYMVTLDADGDLFVSQQEDNSIVRIMMPKSSIVAKPKQADNK